MLRLRTMVMAAISTESFFKPRGVIELILVSIIPALTGEENHLHEMPATNLLLLKRANRFSNESKLKCQRKITKSMRTSSTFAHNFRRNTATKSFAMILQQVPTRTIADSRRLRKRRISPNTQDDSQTSTGVRFFSKQFIE